MHLNKRFFDYLHILKNQKNIANKGINKVLSDLWSNLSDMDTQRWSSLSFQILIQLLCSSTLFLKQLLVMDNLFSSIHTLELNSQSEDFSLNPLNKKIGISSQDEIVFRYIRDIIYCKADGCYTSFYLKSGEKFVSSRNISALEEKFPSDFFFRTHKSYLVNVFELETYIRKDGGYRILSNGDTVPVSCRKKEQFLKFVDRI